MSADLSAVRMFPVSSLCQAARLLLPLAPDRPGRRFEEYVGQSALAAELVAQGVAASNKGKVAAAATQGMETIKQVQLCC